MKRGIILSMLLILIFSCNVYAAEEDILKDPIQEDIKDNIKEEIKEDIKEDVKVGATRGNTTNPSNAVLLQTYFYLHNNALGSMYCRIDNISIGEKYRLKINSYRLNNITYNNIVLYPEVGYFVRGEEYIGQTLNAYVNDTVYNGYINRMSDSIGSLSDYGYAEIYVPPEPTPYPTPEPTQEPVDPETISGNEILREILITNRGIAENVKGIYKYLSDNSISDSVSDNDTISDNIIYKPIKDYNTSESIALVGLILAFSALIIYLIHKTVFKIRR